MEKENDPFPLRELGPSPPAGFAFFCLMWGKEKKKSLLRDGNGLQTPGSSSAHDPKNGCVREPPWGFRPSQPERACPPDPQQFWVSLWGAVCMALYVCSLSFWSQLPTCIFILSLLQCFTLIFVYHCFIVSVFIVSLCKSPVERRK